MKLRTSLSIAAAGLLLAAAAGAPARAESVGSTLGPGQSLNPGQQLVSPNGQHTLDLTRVEAQPTLGMHGSVCALVPLTFAADDEPLHREQLLMQTDGDLVLRTWDFDHSEVIWSTGTRA